MDFSLIQTALELGLICSLTVLALFLSYSMLNVCDLSTDGCFTLGAAVGAVVAISGHPYLALPAAMAAGVCSGYVTALLQTRMGVNSLLAGIIVNTGLYSINIWVMSRHSLYQDQGAFGEHPLGGSTVPGSGGGGCHPGDPFSGGIFKYQTGTGYSGYRQQSGHGTIFFHQSGVYYNRWPVRCQRLYRSLRLSSGTDAKVCEYRHRQRHGHNCPGVASDRGNLFRAGRHPAAGCAWCLAPSSSGWSIPWHCGLICPPTC